MMAGVYSILGDDCIHPIALRLGIAEGPPVFRADC
jgi:hypothetical protein